MQIVDMLNISVSVVYFNMHRREKVEMVAMHKVQIIEDQWDLFSALMFMRRNLEMSCKESQSDFYFFLIIDSPSGPN